MTDDEKIAEAQVRYRVALHGVQSGVVMEIELGVASDATPKHLRVGVNAAMSDHAALVYLLVEKKIITELEYFRSMAKFMEREKESYEKSLSQRLGKRVTLA